MEDQSIQQPLSPSGACHLDALHAEGVESERHTAPRARAPPPPGARDLDAD